MSPTIKIMWRGQTEEEQPVPRVVISHQEVITIYDMLMDIQCESVVEDLPNP
jgi:hypothetical protein